MCTDPQHPHSNYLRSYIAPQTLLHGTDICDTTNRRWDRCPSGVVSVLAPVVTEMRVA